MSAPDSETSPPESVDATPRKRVGRALLLAFCCAHAAYLIYSVVPAPPAQDNPGHPVLDFYRLALGGRQIWNMFDTIPVLHSLEVRVVGDNGTREGLIVGPVLPGFAPYPKPENVRYYNGFYRLLLANEKYAYREAYLRKMAGLIAREPSLAPVRDWAVVVNQEYTRTLFHIRRDRHVGMPVEKSFELPPVE